ncbi:DsbE family thiol:disulfide interchange protein [Sansalvadorimonas verongulae]|uniref:DsbE family thiol:disulfide interchange protein n=1 Tax=Sansalvadorimonas verongulae TaxID=2172824 RepID=UPI0012BCE892|nr:DsbE family thiol:disulfide interchange protein [Sansalvadorimonas verongulae]MTI13786.1 DsbE family thiol:disulfide interchange protein [Sansalvadorimonas verongulae]
MKRVFLLLPLLVLMALGVLFFRGLSLDDTVPSALIAKPFPVFSLPSLEEPGTTLTEGILKGQVSLVNVWGSWCPTCYAEHPYLLELAEQGVVIFGMNYKDEGDKAIAWLNKLGDPYRTNFVDADGRLGIDLGVRGAPETFLVDADGVIRYKHEGEVNARVWNDIFEPILAQLNQEREGKK